MIKIVLEVNYAMGLCIIRRFVVLAYVVNVRLDSGGLRDINLQNLCYTKL